jgi:hypothetical protein
MGGPVPIADASTPITRPPPAAVRASPGVRGSFGGVGVGRRRDDPSPTARVCAALAIARDVGWSHVRRIHAEPEAFSRVVVLQFGQRDDVIDARRVLGPWRGIEVEITATQGAVSGAGKHFLSGVPVGSAVAAWVLGGHRCPLRLRSGEYRRDKNEGVRETSERSREVATNTLVRGVQTSEFRGEKNAHGEVQRQCLASQLPPPGSQMTTGGLVLASPQRQYLIRSRPLKIALCEGGAVGKPGTDNFLRGRQCESDRDLCEARQRFGRGLGHDRPQPNRDLIPTPRCNVPMRPQRVQGLRPNVHVARVMRMCGQ